MPYILAKKNNMFSMVCCDDIGVRTQTTKGMFAHDIGLCFLRVCPHMTKSFAENICIIISTLITL